MTPVEFAETEIDYKVVAKFYLQVFVLFVTHVIVFWLFPMSGDYIRTGELYCPFTEEQQAKAHNACNDFEYNTFTIIFYLLNLLYFWTSALQIKHGLTESLTSTHRKINDLSESFYGIPFLFELKTSIDWMHSKTTLGIFDWLRVFWVRKMVKDAMKKKKEKADSPYGQLTKINDKILKGGSIFCIIMLSIFGPLLLFSTFNPISAANNPY